MEEEGKKMSRVKVQSILSVVSSNPTRPGKVHKLSILDQAMGQHTIHIVFYYGSNPFRDGPMTSDLENFRISLSDVLDEFPVVTGRLTRGPDDDGGWQVKCNDAGVRVLQARVNASVDEWLRSADVDEERDLTVWEDMPLDPSFWSPFRIQVNNFKCGGIAIGVSCTHMHADITSATLLIKSWADFHSAQPLTYPPIFTLPTHTPPQNNTHSTPPILPTLPHSPDPTPPIKMATITMKFSGPTVEKCLSQVTGQCPDATPFDVLVVLLWSKIAQWQASPIDDPKRSISICTDSRRNQGEIPLGYFGNALSSSVLSVGADELSSGKLGQVCEYVHRHAVETEGEGFGQVLSGGDGAGPFRVYGPWLTCVSMEHMVDAENNGEAIMYSTVFGNNNNKGEQPIHVSYFYGNVVGEGMIVVVPTAEVGLGRAVTVTLPEEQIDKLCKDQEILDLEPVLVISGGR